MTTKRKPDMENVQILRAERLKMSRNGNPRFQVTFFDGDGQWTYNTKSDSSISYDVENYYRAHTHLDVWLTRRDTIEYMKPTTA